MTCSCCSHSVYLVVVCFNHKKNKITRTLLRVQEVCSVTSPRYENNIYNTKKGLYLNLSVYITYRSDALYNTNAQPEWQCAHNYEFYENYVY